MSSFNRREFLKSLGVLTSAGMMDSLLSRCSLPREKEKKFKNIVVIIGDDHTNEVLGCYGNNIIRTPNLDRMAKRGVRFTNAYSNAPLSSASRQSILTGKYPHAAKVTLLRTPFNEEQVTIADHLGKYGFRSAIIGKNHFNNEKNHGFDVKIESDAYHKWLEENPPKQPPDSVKTRPPWRPFRDPASVWLNAEGLPSNRYDADSEGTFLANKAVDFIQDNKDNRFCLCLGFHEPHSPFNFPIEYQGKYDPKNMPLPEGSPEDDRWIPEEFKDLTDEEKRGIIASYYTSVEYLDKNVGIVLDGIEKAGLSDETIVVYIGDQGYLLNHHKRFEKHMMWEEAVKAPLIIQAGDAYGRGRVVESLVEFVDLAPTLLDAVGVDDLPDSQGKSLMPLLRKKTGEHKEYVFSEFMADNKAMVRSERWKYIFTTGKHDLAQGYATGKGAPGITHRLYDLKNDPRETTNLADKLQYQDIKKKLQQVMIDWFKETYPDKLPSDKNTIEEKLMWFCRPTEKNPDMDAK